MDTRRNEILAIAGELFANLGYHNTSMEDIAHEVDIKKASLYYHFPGKSELLWTILEDGIEQLLNDSREALDSTATDALSDLEKLLSVHAAHVEMHRDRIVVFLTERRALADGDEHQRYEQYIRWRKEYESLFEGVIQQGQRQGAIRQGDAKLMAYGIVGMYNWLIQWYDPNGPLSLNNIHRNFFDWIVHGIAVPSD